MISLVQLSCQTCRQQTYLGESFDLGILPAKGFSGIFKGTGHQAWSDQFQAESDSSTRIAIGMYRR